MPDEEICSGLQSSGSVSIQAPCGWSCHSPVFAGRSAPDRLQACFLATLPGRHPRGAGRVAVRVVKSGADKARGRAVANAPPTQGAKQFEERRRYLQAVVRLGDAVAVADAWC